MPDLNRLRVLMARALRASDPVEALAAVCRASAEVLPVDGAAISTMTSTRHRETLCASDAVANGLEELQFTLGEGPCFESFDAGVPVLVPDLDASSGVRWPVYASRVAEESKAAAVFVFPLRFASLRIGTLSTYRSTPGPVDAETVAAAGELAETAALVLLGLQDPAGEVALAQRHAADRDLGGGPSGHERVHLAAGMLAERLGLHLEAALDRMRGQAFVENRYLIDVASDVLGQRPGTGTGPEATDLPDAGS